MNHREKYFYGPSPVTQQWNCGYSGDRGQTYCLADGAWHGIAVTAQTNEIDKNLISCDDHRHYMSLLTDFIHTLDSACGIGETWWNWETDDSGCTVDWDTAPTLLLAAEPTGAGV